MKSDKRIIRSSAGERAVREVARVANEYHLSPREAEVLAAASEGSCTKEIATRMGVSGKAVEYFWGRIYLKLGCASQVEVMALLLHRAYEGPDRGTA